LEELAATFAHRVTTLEVDDLRFIANTDAAAIPTLVYVLPNLYTVRIQLREVAENLEALRDILSGKRGIKRIERLVDKSESPDDVRRNNERWDALCIEHKMHDLLA
jgi:hypothetical protein